MPHLRASQHTEPGRVLPGLTEPGLRVLEQLFQSRDDRRSGSTAYVSTISDPSVSRNCLVSQVTRALPPRSRGASTQHSSSRDGPANRR